MKKLHWFLFRFRVDFKLLLLTHNAYHHNSPLYLANCIATKTIPRSAKPAVTSLLKSRYQNRNHGLHAMLSPVLYLRYIKIYHRFYVDKVAQTVLKRL